MLSEQPNGVDRVWLLEDEFAFKYFQQYYKNNKHEGKSMTYAFEKYEVIDFVTTRYSNDRNMLSQLCNSLVTGLNLYLTTPKLIVVVLDDNIVRYIDSRGKDEITLGVEIGTITEYLAREFERAILSYQDNLPTKAKRSFYPHVLWISPPTHKSFGKSSNLKREIQGNCLSTVVKFRQNQSVLRMVKVWEHDDANAFLYENYRFTTQGLTKYWLSIDSAIRYWDVAVFPKLGIHLQKAKGNQKGNKYKWKKPN